jgi:hypothetical protein
MDLRKLCRPDNGPYLRPFQPNANWESAKVFIVGTNPSREIGPADCEYDDFIDSVLGNGQLFDSIYSSKGESKTRDYMQSLINGISANTLITNLYWRPTRKAKFLTESDKDTALFGRTRETRCDAVQRQYVDPDLGSRQTYRDTGCAI